MLVLKEYQQHDIKLCNSEVILTDEQVSYYEDTHYLRTFIDTNTKRIVAVGMVQKCGEIGLIIDNTLLKKHIRKFYTLLVIYAAEAFAYIDTDTLFTGIKPNTRDQRWIKFLGFEPSLFNDIDHESIGWGTFELPLSRWVYECNN